MKRGKNVNIHGMVFVREVLNVASVVGVIALMFVVMIHMFLLAGQQMSVKDNIRKEIDVPLLVMLIVQVVLNVASAVKVTVLTYAAKTPTSLLAGQQMYVAKEGNWEKDAPLLVMLIVKVVLSVASVVKVTKLTYATEIRMYHFFGQQMYASDSKTRSTIMKVNLG